MKTAVLKTYGKFIALLLSIIGFFVGCEQIQPMYGTIVEYGVPNAYYVVKGNVKNASTSKPLNNIRIVVPNLYNSQYGDTVYTSANGDYEIRFNSLPDFDKTYKVIASDIDGNENSGVFQSDTLKIQFSSKDKIKNGTGNWNQGTFQKTNQNFSLQYEAIAMYGVMPASYKEKEQNENID